MNRNFDELILDAVQLLRRLREANLPPEDHVFRVTLQEAFIMRSAWANRTVSEVQHDKFMGMRLEIDRTCHTCGQKLP